jgi:archaeal flagellar protein FlaI
MSLVTLPFVLDRTKLSCDRGLRCPVRQLLPKGLQEAMDSSWFLHEYLHALPISEVGVPDFYPRLSRDLRDLEERNLIYPTKNGLFVHVYPDNRAERDIYVPIEPHLTVDMTQIMPEVDTRLMVFTEAIGRTEDEETKRAVLMQALDSILTTSGATNSQKLRVTPRELEAITYLLIREKVGFGLLQPLLLDTYIEDISCSGVGHIFLEHKIFRSVQCCINFPDELDLNEFVIWMGEWIKRPVTVRNPIVDAVLPDGSRINIVYGTDISKRGSNFTIRKFSETPASIMEVIEFGTMNYMMAAYLSFVLEEGLNLFVCGATASGKTTTLNAITTFIGADKKIVTIEDTPELQVPHKNWIRETTRGAGREEKGAQVGMFDLLKAALRQRPDRIIVGEIRGEEGAIAFQAMQSGHGVMSTFHAASVEKLIQRLTGEPINIPKAYVDNLDIVLVQAAVKTPGKGMARRVTSINEIVGYDSVSKTFSFIESFRWNPATDEFEFPGYMNSFIMEERIAPKRGIPPFKRKAIYTELKRRAKIFERLHKERKVKGFYEVFQVLAEAQRQHLI